MDSQVEKTGRGRLADGGTTEGIDAPRRERWPVLHIGHTFGASYALLSPHSTKVLSFRSWNDTDELALVGTNRYT